VSSKEEAEQATEKQETELKAAESVGENQPVWLSTLKEEITNLE
jgi:hypothetical protein